MMNGQLLVEGTVRRINQFLDTGIHHLPNGTGQYELRHFPNVQVAESPRMRVIEAGGHNGQVASVALSVSIRKGPNLDNLSKLSRDYQVQCQLQMSSAESTQTIMTDPSGNINQF